MDGEQKMNVGMIVEIAINFVQQFVFIGFLYLFFEKKYSGLKNALGFWIPIVILFTMANYFTYKGLTLNHLDTIIITVVMLIYSLFFLKGFLYLRLIVPVIIMALNILIANINLNIMVYFGNMPFVEALTFSSAFRYLYIIISNLIYIVILLVILRIGKQKLHLSNIPEIISFLLIAIVICIAALSDMILYEVSGFNTAILPYVVIICISIFALTGMFWFLLLKVSKDSKLKTELLLSKQREEMYKNSVLSTNEQIEKLSKVKHDMKNNTMTVSSLISDGEYEKAKAICDTLSTKLSVPNVCYCKNPVLNAIINVEIDKALQYNIDFSYTITENLPFVEDVDIVSIVGNICDNAIEYLSSVDIEKKRLNLDVSSYKDYCCITCKNNILTSVLENNPEMKSTKVESDLHGKGMSILREIANRYDGELIVKEHEKELIVSVILRQKN